MQPPGRKPGGCRFQEAQDLERVSGLAWYVRQRADREVAVEVTANLQPRPWRIVA
jgi:hypothetical protein